MFEHWIRGAVCAAAMVFMGCVGSPDEESTEPSEVSTDEAVTPQAARTAPCRTLETLVRYDPAYLELAAKDRNGNGLLCVEVRGKRERYSDDRVP
jgi:hypothetical protein